MIWSHIKNLKNEGNIHKVGAYSVDFLMRQAILRKTLDNITVVMISL
jgi:hypothetical protein